MDSHGSGLGGPARTDCHQAARTPEIEVLPVLSSNRAPSSPIAEPFLNTPRRRKRRRRRPRQRRRLQSSQRGPFSVPSQELLPLLEQPTIFHMHEAADDSGLRRMSTNERKKEKERCNNGEKNKQGTTEETRPVRD